ncbi:alpha/beta hydrolase [Kribbella turkmenica]|uniref:Alpha/beta hydrolase n=1 Tax=Kribbella turkmenica TaxID=2530375 RepID=A0A4R4XGT7_9ACTN|nr:alpha/beta hydrolase [Kribbella turkmenica]TDD30026.1 alpha/beta hydrolase [Kribbella turkmenica]
MNDRSPVVVLVHGAFADASSWNGVAERLLERSIDVVAVANPLRGLSTDASYVRDVVAGIGRPVLLVGHSYGGMVITQAGADNENVVGLVYVDAFAPDHGENAFQLSLQFPGSTLGDALNAYPVAGGNEFAIRTDDFQQQFCADVPAAEAALMAVTQRPVTEAALTEGLPAQTPAWKSLPSWFVYSDGDRNIPVELHRWLAERAGAKGRKEIAGASHALSVSEPAAVTATILEALGS